MIRWLVSITVALAIAGVRIAAAGPSVAPDPVAIDPTQVGDTGEVTATLSTTDASDLVDLDLSGTGCAVFAITPDSNISVTSATTVALDVQFTPVARGAASCHVPIFDHVSGTLIGAFDLTSSGIGAVLSAPASVGFGNVRVTPATAKSTQVVTLKNTGDDGTTLHITALAFGGLAPGDYSFATPPTLPIDVPASGQTTVSVVFNPTASGTRAATLTVTSDSVGAPTTNIALTGTGTNAVVGVSDLDFGIVHDGSSGAGNITISNTAAPPVGPLHVTSATLTDASGWFSFSSPACTGTTCTINQNVSGTPITLGMTCTPTPADSTGTVTATVKFTTDSDTTTDDTATLTCTAGRPEIQVDHAAISFGDVNVGQQNTVTVTIHNDGNEQLVYSLTKSGGQTGQFTLSNGCLTACTIDPGAPDKTVDVAFVPTVPGVAATTLVVTNNSPGDSPLNIPLDGNGLAPKISAPATVAIGSVEVGATGTNTLQIKNTGNSTLTITSADFDATSSPALTVQLGNKGTQTVAPNATADWTLACTPTTNGAIAGSFKIASDAFNATTTTVAVSCTGLLGVLTVDTDPLDFGGVRIGDVVTKNLVLKNTGNLAVTLTTQSPVTPTKGYSITSTLPASLAPNATATVTVQFAPAAITDGGSVTASIHGTSGAAVNPVTVDFDLEGTPLDADFSVNPPAIAFGDLRWDEQLTQTFTITQSDDPAIKIQSIDITPETAVTHTQTGEFKVLSIKHGAATVTLPFQLTAKNDQLVVTVQVDPADRLGPLQADLAVHSDLGTNPDRHIALTANSVTPELTLDPTSAAVDFGGVDVLGSPAIAHVTIKNSGDAPLDLGTITTGGSTKFTFTLPPAQQLLPNATAQIDVTYTPTVEAQDAGTITIPLTGIFGLAGPQTVTLAGKGIDRHIDVATSVTFPDTFRYPDDPPVMTIPVKNLGDANLHLSMVTTSSQYAVTNTGAMFDVAGQGTLNVTVQFSPEVTGPANGTLTIVDNDAQKPMAVIQLVGNGIDRDVQLNPGMAINLGITPIGVPLHLEDVLPEGLQVQNMDATHTFRMHKIDIQSDDTGWSLPDAPATDAMLAASSTTSVDVAYTPDKEGPSQATIELFLDNDPVARTVQVNANGTFVDAHGSGGCDGGGGGAGIGAGLAAVGLMLWRRKKGLRASGFGQRLAVGAVVMGSVGSASADSTRNVDLSLFDPTPTVSGEGFQLQSPTVANTGDWAAWVVVSYARKPLAIVSTFPTTTTDLAISDRLQYDLGGAYVYSRFELGAHLPLFTQSGDAATTDADTFSEKPASGTAVGDLVLHGKAHLLRTAGGLELGGAVALTLPTASDEMFAGVKKPEGRILALGSYDLAPRVIVQGNAGLVLRGTSQFENIEQKSGLLWGGGGYFHAADDVWLTGELFGEITPSGHLTRPAPGMPTGSAALLTRVEVLFGVRYQLTAQASLGVGIGRGLDDAIGSPALRGVIGVTYVPTARSLEQPRVIRPDGDADGDGIPDSVDKCPNEPEDKDMFDDGDGCPDPDNDHDGIPDDKDRCPLDPEDVDGFQDQDGCPDRDNDGDGIPDDKDKCPNAAEDKDGFEDLDGCPDLDNDHDGIPDDKDKCPNAAETINGVQDEDGCPDNGDSTVMVGADHIDLFDPVQFQGTKIAKKSNNVLGQVASQLKAHSEILRVRIAVHVQPSKDPDRDVELTTARANAVRDFLIARGVAAERIEAHGYGGSKPLVPADQKGSQSANERLEIVIVEKK